MTVRRARPADYRPLMRVVEGALLDVDAAAVRDRVDAGEVLVAVDGDRVVGGLVRDGSRVIAVAVVPGRRGEGIGRTLVERADAETDEPLSATFDGRVRGFYEALGFAVEPDGEGRYRGVRR